MFSRYVMSNSLWLHGLQHTRLPCPPSPGACSNSCPSKWWFHPIITSSVDHFFSCLQSFPASESFPMSWLFVSGGQNIRASASFLPVNIQGWFPLGLTSLVSFSPRDSQESPQALQFKSINYLVLSLTIIYENICLLLITPIAMSLNTLKRKAKIK